MIPVLAAESIILNAVTCLSTEWIELTRSCGRVIAESIISSVDVPAHNTSSMDGYAVRAEDVQQTPIDLELIDTVPAGICPQIPIGPQQAVRLYTGSMMPSGTDAVVMQEHTEKRSDTTVTILESVASGCFVRQQGDFCRSGDVVIPVGLRLGGAELAVLAAMQRSNLLVYRQPRVAILSTGNELVRIDQTLQPGQIVDSNQYGLAALVELAGGIPLRQGIGIDQPEILKAKLRQALLDADVVISTGGVSVGDYDLVEAVLAELESTLMIQQVAMKPGKPLTFATCQLDALPKLFFGLPGNPVSAMVTFWRFVQPALAKLQGQQSPWGPQWVAAVTQSPLKADGKRETYLWGHLHWKEGQLYFQAVGQHNSGNLINLAGCSGLAVVPMGTTQIPADQVIQVLVIPR